MGESKRASLASSLPPTIKGALTEESSPSPATLSPETNLHICYMTTTQEVLFLYSNHRSSTNHTPSSLINRLQSHTTPCLCVFPPTCRATTPSPYHPPAPPYHLHTQPDLNTSLPATTYALTRHPTTFTIPEKYATTPLLSSARSFPSHIFHRLHPTIFPSLLQW